MYSTWFHSYFLSAFKSPEIKLGGANFLGETNCAERLKYLVFNSVFQVEKFTGPNSFIIHLTSMHST